MAHIALQVSKKCDRPKADSQAPAIQFMGRYPDGWPSGEAGAPEVEAVTTLMPSPVSALDSSELKHTPSPFLGEADFPARRHLLLSRRRRTGLGFAFLSVSFHVILIVGLGWKAPSQDLGSGGEELEAISVEVIESTALESIEAQQSKATAGAAEPTEATPGQGSPVEQNEVIATKTTELPKEQPDETPLPPDVVHDDNAELLPAAKEEPHPTDKLEEVANPEKEPDPDATVDKVPEKEQAALAAGGAATRAQEESSDSEAAAGASKGQADRYAIRVRLALNKAHPKHSGNRGRVQVIFQLSETGNLETANVVHSSGLNDLDEAVLSALRMTHFPPPPAGMTARQRTFLVPFDFR